MTTYLNEADALKRALVLGHLKRERRLKHKFHQSRLWLRLVRNSGAR